MYFKTLCEIIHEPQTYNIYKANFPSQPIVILSVDRKQKEVSLCRPVEVLQYSGLCFGS